MLPLVSLVGYTNAGKSTIMNMLLEHSSPYEEDKKVLEKDMLFATLDTSIRHIDLPDGKSFLLSDTVGFVSDLLMIWWKPSIPHWRRCSMLPFWFRS